MSGKNFEEPGGIGGTLPVISAQDHRPAGMPARCKQNMSRGNIPDSADAMAILAATARAPNPLPDISP